MERDALFKKLRLKHLSGALIVNGPAEIQKLLSEAHTLPGKSKFPFVLLFVHNKAELNKLFPQVATALDDEAVFWIAYPKKSSPLASDINRDTGWEPVHAAGYGPVSQVAIDHTWSALRFRPENNINRKPDSLFNQRARK
ncbi:hypothetical protein AB9P05_12170 [Roseivirga sp. BDSF3-8]|uniref:hypothetical protein n=1 Tax=Roseivirga sp. BDSF3-8 TaxID=3241598 RepID=UPI003531D217